MYGMKGGKRILVRRGKQEGGEEWVTELGAAITIREKRGHGFEEKQGGV